MYFNLLPVTQTEVSTGKSQTETFESETLPEVNKARARLFLISHLLYDFLLCLFRPLVGLMNILNDIAGQRSNRYFHPP